MKKVLSVLGLIAILGTAAPANAAPGGHKGPHGGFHRPPHTVVHVAPRPPHHYDRGSAFVGGVLARRSYWGYPHCGYRLGWYDDFCRPYPPTFTSGIYIRF